MPPSVESLPPPVESHLPAAVESLSGDGPDSVPSD
jgi:hypothetical protein